MDKPTCRQIIQLLEKYYTLLKTFMRSNLIAADETLTKSNWSLTMSFNVIL